MRTPAALATRPEPFARPPVPVPDLAAIVATATTALREAARLDALHLEDVARWCAEVGGVDPQLERAALIQALALVHAEVLVADVAATLQARLVAAGPLLPVLVARGGVARVLTSLGLDDVEPAPRALRRAVPPRVARFYWQRLRAFVSWSASCAWS
jgi:hypothetical protein